MAGDDDRVEAPTDHRRLLQAGSPNSDRRRRPVLVVGHYCHDRITLPGGSRVDALGGSVSYIVNVFKALGMHAEIVSKVGPDFVYTPQLSHIPHVIESQFTTEFFADFTSGEDRLLSVGNVCEPIFPHDILSNQTYELGLAVGVAGEVLPETIERMAQKSRIVIADVQALIRDINPISGLVSLRRLEDTPYYSHLRRISFLKAARVEASFIDIEQVRQMTCVIVTEGENGSRVYSKDSDFRVPPFHATELDPTGAGDCFLAGFSAGLYQGLSVYQAVRMGNYFGALAVEQIGVPLFTDKQLEDSAFKDSHSRKLEREENWTTSIPSEELSSICGTVRSAGPDQWIQIHPKIWSQFLATLDTFGDTTLAQVGLPDLQGTDSKETETSR